MLSIPITILHGFLGSGKTTVLRSLLSQSQNAEYVPSVIVNDMSELDVDGVLVMNTDVVNENHGNFVTISGDSVSSPEGIKKLDKALHQLVQDKQPPWILIETSGSSHPLPLVEFFKGHSVFTLKGVVTLVDSTWLKDDYDLGKALIPKWQDNLQKGIRSIENL
ncbi:MAG: GTP-binding protein, partial [Cytophagales bacterium]|nr:GTP-binding protein [Cytophagales bacterium]